MRKILLLITISLPFVGTTSAQTGKRSVEATHIELIHNGDAVQVKFRLHAGKKATKATYNLVVDPILRGKATQCQLPSIIIQGSRSKAVDRRHTLATGKRAPQQQEPVYIAPGESFDYSTTFPYEEWMRGGQLLFEGVSVGCCSTTEVNLGLIANNILDAEPVIETQIVAVEDPVDVQPATTGDKLAKKYAFVAPMEELAQIEKAMQGENLDYNMPFAGKQKAERIIEATREGSISIFFQLSGRVIDQNFSTNNANLVELISAVRALSEADDIRVIKIVIAGFSSPEGAVDFNERLALDRAVAVKNFLTSNSSVDPRAIEIYNGGADWTGLRDLVKKSDLHNKERIIDIINNTPIWDAQRNTGRRSQLMRLDGGKPYRHMVREFFPQLRQAAYIKVYYENK